MFALVRVCSPSPVLDYPALTLQSSRSLDTLSDLKLQRLEAELEGARHQAQGACQREQEVKAECERLQEELKQIQNNHIERVSEQHTHLTHTHLTHWYVLQTGTFSLYFLKHSQFCLTLVLAWLLLRAPAC